MGNLVPAWVFHVPRSTRLQVTPLVADGVMYITNTNEVYALDARTGRRLWHYKHRNAKSTHGNRGVALLGDRVFFASSDAHLIALDRRTGAAVWDVEYAQHEKGYFATLAPLAIDGKIIVGVSGGDCGAQGYVDAYHAESGKHAWRFWVIPGPGEPGSETWGGLPAEISGGATWMTGVYDPQEKVLYWTTGNPGSPFYGGARPGDNLYANSVLALHPDTGKLKWYFQFTPHDTHDWDAQEFPVLIDTQFQGRQQKLLAQANRNGFFYVLERRTGKMLLAKPFVKKLTWAKSILPNGRPDVIPGSEPTPGWKPCLPGHNWSNQLVFSFLRFRNWTVLRHSARAVWHLHQFGPTLHEGGMLRWDLF